MPSNFFVFSIRSSPEFYLLFIAFGKLRFFCFGRRSYHLSWFFDLHVHLIQIYAIPHRRITTNQITQFCFYPDTFAVLPVNLYIYDFKQICRDIAQPCSYNKIDIVLG